MKEKKMHKGLVSGDDFELISRNEDRNDHVVETVDRVLNVIEEEGKDERGEGERERESTASDKP